jgi:hypothetical protein
MASKEQKVALNGYLMSSFPNSKTEGLKTCAGFGWVIHVLLS